MKVLPRRRGAVLVNSVLGVALLAGGALAYSTVNSTSSAAAGKQTTRTATVTKGTVLATVSGSGTLSSPTDAAEDFVTGGRLTAVKVAVGDTVTQGEVLATVDTTAAQQSLDAANSALSTAQAGLASAQANLTKAQAGTTTTSTVPVGQAGSVQQSSFTGTRGPSAGASPSASDAGATAPGTTATDAAPTDSQAAQPSGSSQSQASNPSTSRGGGSTSGGSSTPAPQYTTITTTKVDPAAVAQAQQQVTQAQQQVATAQTNVTNAQTALAGTTLTASVGGTVASISNKVGDTVSGTGSSGGSSAGSGSSGSKTTTSTATPTGFIVITNPSGMQVTANFSELDSLKLQKGQPATVTLNAQSDTILKANVLSVSPLPVSSGSGSSSSGAVQYSALLQITSDTSKLRTGMSATISVVTGEADNALSVSASALSGTGTTRTATVVKPDGTTSRVTVTVGIQGDTTDQVVDGLSEGDKVQIIPTTSGGSNGFPSGSFPGGFGGGAGGFGGGARTGGGTGGSRGGN